MEGVWIFLIPARQGGGVITARNGKIFGGDIAYYLEGTYSEQGDMIEAKMNAQMFNPHNLVNIWGDGARQFQLSFKGKRTSDTITGKIQRMGVPMPFDVTLTRRADAP